MNGNLLSDGTRNFAYDDENELVSVWKTNVWRNDFLYDGKMRRRILKKFIWNAATTTWQPASEVRYIYSGNLVLQERDGSNVPQVTYTRGKDLRGNLQGAGGIGGLLARTDNSKLLFGDVFASAFYHADGNGNVTSLIYTNQTIAAKYLYDPYGNILSQSGLLADANVYRFSSKEWNVDFGLYYFLYRFYDPNLQRWLNADPIGVSGGINLYEFVGNSPIIWLDAEGLALNKPVPPGQDSIICKGGKLVIQNNNKGPDRACTDAHEKQHEKDWKERYGNDLCNGVPDGYLPVGGPDYNEWHRKSECKAHAAGKKCRDDLLAQCEKPESDPEKEKQRKARRDELQNSSDSDQRLMDNIYNCKPDDFK